MRRALITGINGMDGSHLAELLLNKGYEVYGLERKSTSGNRENTKHIEDRIGYITGDMTDKSSLDQAIKISDPHVVYNLAAQSFVGKSWSLADYTSKVNALGVLYILQSILNHNKDIRFYQASTSEMFGNSDSEKQNEQTPFNPRSPYGVAKLYGYWITRSMRESYGLFACNGILFNHESEKRGKEFVTRKICRGVARIYYGLEDHIALGNLESKRDWGYAPDYVDGMYRMLEHDEPGDYVLATGVTRSIREFLDAAFGYVDIKDWEKYVVVDPQYFRPAEIDVLKGDYSKASKILGWEPKTQFEDWVGIMMESELAKAAR